MNVDNCTEIASKRGLRPPQASPWTRPDSGATHIVTAVTGCTRTVLTEAGRLYALEAQGIERRPAKSEAASSNLARGTMGVWRSGKRTCLISRRSVVRFNPFPLRS